MIICFDLDGTLMDTEKWIINSQVAALEKNGVKITEKQLYDLWGLTLSDQVKKLKPGIKEKELKKINKDFHKIRFSDMSGVKPFKNTKGILETLSKKYSLCLVSNNSHKSILKVLEKTKLDKNLFKVIVGSNEVKHPKPFPDEIYKAEKTLKKQVHFMVGDSKQDIKTAKAAKVKSIIILNAPKQTWKDLKKADFMIKDIKELPKLIKEVSK